MRRYKHQLPKHCKICDKSINLRGRPNKSGNCSSCWERERSKRKYKEKKENANKSNMS